MLGQRKRRFRENNYNLANSNCEHFANMIVHGINYSEQVENNSLIGLGYSNKKNGKGSTINLGNEINEVADKFGWTTPYQWRAAEILERIEIPPKENCRIM